MRSARVVSRVTRRTFACRSAPGELLLISLPGTRRNSSVPATAAITIPTTTSHLFPVIKKSEGPFGPSDCHRKRIRRLEAELDAEPHRPWLYETVDPAVVGLMEPDTVRRVLVEGVEHVQREADRVSTDREVLRETE